MKAITMLYLSQVCDNILITDGTARLCDILNAALVSALNVVAEGEEGIGTQGNAGQLIQPCAFFFSRKNWKASL